MNFTTDDIFKDERIDWTLVNQIAGGRITEPLVTRIKQTLSRFVIPSIAYGPGSFDLASRLKWEEANKNYREFRYGSYTPANKDAEEIVNTGTDSNGRRPSKIIREAFERYCKYKRSCYLEAPIHQPLLEHSLHGNSILALQRFLDGIPRPYTNKDLFEFYNKGVKVNTKGERRSNWRNIGEKSFQIMEDYLSDRFFRGIAEGGN